jgi:hypothetical protein
MENPIGASGRCAFERAFPGQFPNNRLVSQLDAKVKEIQRKPLKYRRLFQIG